MASGAGVFLHEASAPAAKPRINNDLKFIVDQFRLSYCANIVKINRVVGVLFYVIEKNKEDNGVVLSVF